MNNKEKYLLFKIAQSPPAPQTPVLQQSDWLRAGGRLGDSITGGQSGGLDGVTGGTTNPTAPAPQTADNGPPQTYGAETMFFPQDHPGMSTPPGTGSIVQEGGPPSGLPGPHAPDSGIAPESAGPQAPAAEGGIAPSPVKEDGQDVNGTTNGHNGPVDWKAIQQQILDMQMQSGGGGMGGQQLPAIGGQTPEY